MKKSIYLKIFIAAILGVVVAFCLLSLLQILQGSISSSDEETVGVITPDSINRIKFSDYEETTLSDIKVKHNGKAEVELEVLEYMLDDEQLKPFLVEGVEIYVMPGLENSDIISGKEDQVFFDTGGVVVSGKYIYLTKDFSSLVTTPEKLYPHLFSAFFETHLYFDLDENYLNDLTKKKEKYSFDGLDEVKIYKALFTEEGDDWKNPYPTKSQEYAGIIDVCNDASRVDKLLVCELSIYQMDQISLLPPDVQKFIEENYDINSQATKKSLGLIEQEAFDKYFDGTKFQKSKLEFTAWDIDTYTSGIYQDILSEKYFSNVSDDALQELGKVLEDAGWSSDGQSEKVQDDQFGADTYRIAYVQENPLIKMQLSILVMDTDTMKADCIIEGVGVVYCDQKQSVNKNSDNYLAVSIGQYAKYQID